MNTLGLSMSYEEMEHVNYALTHRIIKPAGNDRVPLLAHQYACQIQSIEQWITLIRRKLLIPILKGVMTQ